MNFRYSRCLTTFSVLLSLAFPSLVRAATLNVPSAAYPTIQSGLDASHDGDTVFVADGTYTGPGNRDIDFKGKNITVTSQNGPTKTIIDCGGYASTDGSGNHRGFYIHSGEKSATISGFTVKNGYENRVVGTSVSASGGGICIGDDGISIENCVIMLTNCTISGNTAQYAGGGVYAVNNNGTTTLTNCLITKNITQSFGGGIYSSSGDSGRAVLTNCAITENTAGEGGGIANIASKVDLVACTVALNHSDIYCPGIYNHVSRVSYMTNCIAVNNSTSRGYSGAGIGYYTGNSEIINGGETITYSDIQGSGYPGTGNIDKDPLFVNVATGDLHLKPGSPCLGAGTSTGAPATDLNGRIRLNPPTIGAYELGTTFNVPSTPYPTIQSGVDAAQNGDTVLVADGTYSGDGNRDIDFHGKSLTVTSKNGPAKTIIDCGGYASTDGSGNHRGFYIHGGEVNAAISGFTVKNGYETLVRSIQDSGEGGGIFNSNSGTIMLTNCIVSSNGATGGGGIFTISGGMFTLINCTVSSNSARDGGGIWTYSSTNGTNTLTNCTIFGNTALNSYGSNFGVTGYSYGGGGILIDNASGTTAVTNCTITGNSVTDYSSNYRGGGGIYNYNLRDGGTTTLTNDIVYNNGPSQIYDYSNSLIFLPAFTNHSDVQGGYPGSDNIDADPLFINALAGDLHLKPGSPCLGAGTSTGAPPTDLDGNPRPNPPSMGAYELAAAPATITGFTLSPAQINAPGPTVTANVTISGTFSKVTVSPAPGSLGSASPTFNLMTNSGGGWGGSFPTAFLKLAKTNPVPFIAVGTRPDGTTASMTATLQIGALPSLTLAVNSDKSTVPAGLTFSVKGVIRNLTTTPASATVTIPVPSQLSFVPSAGFTYNSALNTITWAGPLAASTGSYTFSAEFQASKNAKANTSVTINVTASAPSFQSITQSASIAVDAPPAPVGIDIDTTGAAGQAEGSAIITSSLGTPPLQAVISPVSNLQHAWLGIDHAYDINGSELPSTTDASIGSLAAKWHLVGPGVSPTYAASFHKIGSQCNIQLRLTNGAALMNIASICIAALGPLIGQDEDKPENIIKLYDEFTKITAFQDASNILLHPAPTFWEQGIQFAFIVHDLLDMNPNDIKTLAEIYSKKTGKTIDTKALKTALKAVDTGRAILEISQIVADEIIFDNLTDGADAEITYTGSALRHPEELR